MTVESSYTPTPEDRFSFGLWTVGNVGRDPFGEPTRPPLDPVEAVEKLGELGAWGVSLHDNDLIPVRASLAERDAIVARFQDALKRSGLVVSMATTNLFTEPAFKDGAFTANDPRVRRLALQKTMKAIDLGAELGAPIYVFWGGREGAEVQAAKGAQDALERYREALNFLCEYALAQGYAMRFALEPKPNEPRGDAWLPTVGHALHMISTLDREELWGVNPEVAHETMAGLSFSAAVGQALWAGKLFHVDLNSQRIGRYDQDFRFGQEDIKDAFFLVRMLEEAGYTGPRHFDARPLRVEGVEGIWDFARGCMRTYLILKEKAVQYAADPQIQEARRVAGAIDLALPTVEGGFSHEAVATLNAETHDYEALGARETRNDLLDQLVTELLLGVR
ncbi:MAG TPA: xylose isomerase [Gaiellales bacterium]